MGNTKKWYLRKDSKSRTVKVFNPQTDNLLELLTGPKLSLETCEKLVSQLQLSEDEFNNLIHEIYCEFDYTKKAKKWRLVPNNEAKSVNVYNATKECICSITDYIPTDELLAALDLTDNQITVLISEINWELEWMKVADLFMQF